jgi:hypothetical protein
MTDDIFGLTDIELNEIYIAVQQKRLRFEHPLALDLIKVLVRVKSASRIFVLDQVRRNRESAGIEIPQEFDASVQHALEYYCRDSDVFKKRKVPDEEALFLWPKGKGRGVWALNRSAAKVWVGKKIEQIRKKP